jgi:structural maintenance of chromosome 4
MEVLDEYKKKLEIYLARAKEVENVNEQREKAKQDLDNLMKKRLNDFMTGFSAISLKLKEMYQVRFRMSIFISVLNPL